jgi:hypothetical protein
MAKGQDMNEHPTHPDQADEDILTYEVSDEELEAAGTAMEPVPSITYLTAPTMRVFCSRYCCL